MSEPMSTRMTALAARGRAVTYDAKRAVLSRLLRAWDAAPALRLGQLLLVACKQQEPPLPLFGVEDERLADMVEAMTVVPEDVSLTPSEVALAKVLAAWDAWPETSIRSGMREQSTMLDIGTLLVDARWATDENRLTSDGAALLERAQKAGVL